MINTTQSLVAPTYIINPKDIQIYNIDTLKKVTDSTVKWIDIAKKAKIDVTKQLKKIKQIIDQSPSLTNPRNDFEHEVTLVQQIVFGSLYCNQIIRKIIKTTISLQLEKASLNTNNKQLINLYKDRLTKIIPPKICLRRIAVVEEVFKEVIEILQLMEEEIKKDSEGICSFNQFNNCRY